jgi:hypothetical protein
MRPRRLSGRALLPLSGPHDSYTAYLTKSDDGVPPRLGEPSDGGPNHSYTQERWFEAELHRRRGEVLLCLSDADKAEAERCFRQAMAVAQAQGTKLWELRAAMSLARLWRDQGRPAEAHEVLAPVHDWFTEGFDTIDLKHARALLEELR